MFTLFARAARYASLTPAERAVLRLVEGLTYTALLGAATACVQFLSTHPGASSEVDWQPVLRTCAAGAVVAVLLALAKYFKAHGDPALSVALAAASTQLAQSGQSAESRPAQVSGSNGAQAPDGLALAAADGVPGGVADGAALQSDGAAGSA